MEADYKYLFNKFLHYLSNSKEAKHFYLEGGYVLSFVYKLSRKFSRDIDFTISKKELVETFVERSVFILSNIIKDFYYKRRENKIIVYKKNDYLFDIDYYYLSSKYFEFQEVDLFSEKNKFTFNIHTIKDILCEKILNIVQSNRFEFKDVVDINLIVKTNSEVKDLSRLLQIKSDKKNNFANKSRIDDVIYSEMLRFKTSHKENFNDYNFYKEFEKLLNNLKILFYEKE
ncbi:MAG: nucleotidyl transferase AbiEii/AbiGii toxin family protein [Candidatus Woesearchaeota archaeon]